MRRWLERRWGSLVHEHPDEKFELANYDRGADHYITNLRMDSDSWCAASISQSPSNFGRAALFFVPGVKAGALPPLAQ
jgi:hypothetical protein